MIATQAAVLEMARERLVGLSANEKLKFKMDMIEKANYDYNSRRGRDVAEGIAEGIAKGIAEARAETARKMKAEGCDSAFIAEITGLSVEQIERL